MDEIVYTGRNAAEVRAWVNSDSGADPRETWFITKSSSGPTGLQAWYYVRGGIEAMPDWAGADAAVYDPRTGQWRPLRRGDIVQRQGSGYGVVKQGVKG